MELERTSILSNMDIIDFRDRPVENNMDSRTILLLRYPVKKTIPDLS